MKKILALLLVMIMVLSFVACDNEDKDTTSDDNASTTQGEGSDVTCQHSWGNWETEACALVNRTGIDKRTCSSCSATEERENTENILFNSFYDPGLGQLLYWGFNYDGSLRAY